MTKMSRQELKYLENEKGFLGEIKAFFIIFRGLLVASRDFQDRCFPVNLTKFLKTPFL